MATISTKAIKRAVLRIEQNLQTIGCGNPGYGGCPGHRAPDPEERICPRCEALGVIRTLKARLQERIENEVLVAPCGRTESRAGREFTSESLRQHEATCPDCLNGDEPDFSGTNIVADDDMPDGAYFAIAHELGEL